MSRIILAIAAMFASLAVSVVAEAAPLEAYGRLPNIEEVSISPDGQKLGVILTTGEDRGILIRDLAGGTDQVIRAGNQKVRALSWAGSNHLLITKTTTASIADITAPRAEWTMTQDYSLATGKFRSLGSDFQNGLNVTINQPTVREIDGNMAIFLQGIFFDSGRGQVALYRIDPETGLSKKLHPGFAHTQDWLVGSDGKPIAEEEYDSKLGEWTLKIAQKVGWLSLHTSKVSIERPGVAGFGRDGRSVLVAEPVDGGLAYREISPDHPIWSEPFYKGPAKDPIFDPADHRLIGFQALVGENEVYEFFSPTDSAAWAKIERAYKGQRVSLASWSSDRSRIVVLVQSPTEGATYALVDFKSRHADPIGLMFEKLTPADISQKQPIHFKAQDGLDLSGYLTLPNGREPKGLPLIVLPHGGPATRDEPGFDWWSQALASRGYAVLQVNYRGSGGFGESFEQLGYGQWGRKMQTDLSDGVRYLAAQGTIDPKRVCITGASYGGYATLAGAAFDPGVYRCAAAVSAPSDLHWMVAWTKNHKGIASQRYWTRFMGAEDPKDPVLGEISPAQHADRINIPVLLIHGRDDTVVDLEHTRIMERALKAAGKSVEVVIQPGEDHWLSRGETRLQMLQSVVAFLEKHNPPQ